MKVTVLGASGFIGSSLVNYLRENKINAWAPDRDDPAIYRRNLGNVVYCIGLTADFRSKPFDTVDAHVSTLTKVLRLCKFSSFLYLSSTRLYGSRSGIAHEEDAIRVEPLDLNYLYNISKALGESVCFATGNPGVKVVRLSNVYGSQANPVNFLPSLIKDALEKKRIILRTSLDSKRDYISIMDVISILPKIISKGRHKIYNLASGKNTTNREIVNRLSRLTGCTVKVDQSVRKVSYPTVSIDRLRDEFGFNPSRITRDLGLTINFSNYIKARKR